MDLASEGLEAATADLTYTEGAFVVDGTDRRIGFVELAHRFRGQLDTTIEHKSASAFPSGAHVAEVETDPETGMTELTRYVSIDDCGVVVNATLLDGQVMGGLLQGLGQVFGESCVYTEDGQMVTGSFMDYPMPHANLMQEVTIETVLAPSPTNGLGAKGVGEAGTVGSLPTAMNPIMHALRSRGVAMWTCPPRHSVSGPRCRWFKRRARAGFG